MSDAQIYLCVTQSMVNLMVKVLHIRPFRRYNMISITKNKYILQLCMVKVVRWEVFKRPENCFLSKFRYESP